MSLRVVLITALCALCSALTVYNPPNAGVALDTIEKALDKIINSPHLTKTQLAEAKKVSANVEKTVAELESPEGMKLSKEARASKVTASIKELQQLQTKWQKLNIVDKADLLKKLKAKEEELAKDKKMLKVINLEKALAEKKLALQKLVEMKSAGEAQKQAAAKQEMVAKVLNVAKTLKDGKSGDQIKTVLTYLEGRQHDVTASLAKVDAAEKKHDAELSSLVRNKAPVQDSKDPLAKGQGLIKMLLKQEHRKFQKERVTFQSELKELHQAITSIKKGDVAGLTKVMAHMQGDMDAKSHKFLY